MSGLPEQLPERPPSETEWEELLVRLELYPRAARNLLADAGEAAEALRGVLTEMLGRERWLAETLERLRAGEAVSPGDDFPGGPSFASPGLDAPALLDEVARLRGRSFAAVQRRGLEVWEWTSPRADGAAVTAYQVLVVTARGDGGMLARLREAVRGAVGAC